MQLFQSKKLQIEEASEQAKSIFTERTKKTEEDEFTKKNLENLGKNNNSDDNVLTRERNIRLKIIQKIQMINLKKTLHLNLKTKVMLLLEIKELSAQETAKTIANKATSKCCQHGAGCWSKNGARILRTR